MKFSSMLQHAAGFALLSVSALAFAADSAKTPVAATFSKAAEIPVEVFFKQPDYRSLAISPDGKTLAAVVPINGRGNLILIDIATRKAQTVTASDRFDVSGPEWVGNKYLYFSLNDGQDASGKFRHKGTYYYDIDNRKVLELETTNERKKGEINIDSILKAEGGDSPNAIVEMRMRSKDFSDVYEFSFKTRKYKLLTFDSPGRTTGWILDTKYRPRIAVRDELRPAKGQPQVASYWHLPAEGGKWEKLFEESSYHDGTLYDVLGFDDDDRTLFVSTNQGGRDKMAVFKFDTVTKKFGDLVLEDPVYDVNVSGAHVRLIRTLDKEIPHVVGIAYDAAKPTRVWFGDSNSRQLVESVNSALPDTYNSVSASEDHSVALITSTSDIESGTFFLFDTNKKTLESIVRNREWADPKIMAERKFISFKARDGLPLYGYLTLPRDLPAKGLPLIVNIHGGPQVRGYEFSEWGRWPEAQFFASRGYAVLEMEPRGSEGMGRKTFTLGFKQWGGTMQDDLNDGALFLVKEGIVDKSRMGLLGGSYGGYASLEGMTRDPDLWQCSDSSVAVSDLTLLQNVAWSDIAERDDARTGGYLENEFTVWVGDSKADAELFEKRSPARNAGNVKGPIMLSMGSDDFRVPMIHGEKMRDALLKAGKQVDYKVYTDEGHGFNRDANVFDFYHRGETFFSKCLKNPAK